MLPATQDVSGSVTPWPISPRKITVVGGVAYNAPELAAMKLPGYPGSQQNMLERAKRDGWPSRPRAGGGVEYPIATLPPALRDLIIDHNARLLEPAAPSAAEMVPAVAPAGLKDWQRAVRDARAALCREIGRLMDDFGMSARAACGKLADLAQAGDLTPALAACVKAANHKSGDRRPEMARGGRVVTARTLQRWLAVMQGQGVDALAPAGTAEKAAPAWLPALLALYRRPSKPDLAQCLRELPKHWEPAGGQRPPSYTNARFWLDKQTAQSVNKGRMGPRALLALKAFRRRETANLWPLDVIVADGHTFRGWVGHPVTGKPFQPEVMAVLDVATSKTVGYSAGIAESTHVVMDGLRHAITSHGKAAILYTDNGSGFCNEAVSDEVVGFYARIGLTHEKAEPGRAQARGKIERPNRSLWRASAKKLTAYCGRDMDREAGKAIAKRIDRDIAERGTARDMMGWDEFLGWLAREVEDYNNRPHRGLPKITDPGAKAPRHMTPNEAWDAKVAAMRAVGGDLVTVTKEQADDLFRPHVIRKAIRGEVKLPWGRYFAHALVPHHGDEVQVSYEVQDGSRVWVKDMAGRLICIAERDGNVSDYMPASKIEHARQRRAAGQTKLLQSKMDAIAAEARGVGLIDAEPGGMGSPVIDLTAEEIEAAEAEIIRLMPAATNDATDGRDPDARPNFGDDVDFAVWLLDHPAAATSADAQYLTELLMQPAFRQRLTLEGVATEALAELAAMNRRVKNA